MIKGIRLNPIPNELITISKDKFNTDSFCSAIAVLKKRAKFSTIKYIEYNDKNYLVIRGNGYIEDSYVDITEWFTNKNIDLKTPKYYVATKELGIKLNLFVEYIYYNINIVSN